MIGDIHVGVFYVLLALILTLTISSFVLRMQHAADYFCGNNDCDPSSSAGEILMAVNQGVQGQTETTYLTIAMNISVALLAVGATLVMFNGSKSALGTVNLTIFYIIAAIGLAFLIAGFVAVVNYHLDGRRKTFTELAADPELFQKMVENRRALLWYQSALLPITITGISLALVISMAPMMKN